MPSPEREAADALAAAASEDEAAVRELLDRAGVLDVVLAIREWAELEIERA